MHRIEKKLLIVSMRRKPADFLKQSLCNILGDAVEIDSYSYAEDGPPPQKQKYRLILASGEYSYRKALQSFPGQLVLQSQRDLSLSLFFEQIFLLPKGSKALVINETQQGTIETIEALKQLGIDYLDFHPYWQDCHIKIDPDIKIAISPGMFHICPVDIPQKIDIGMRQLSITVFINILNLLELDMSYTEKYIAHNKALLITAYKRLSEHYALAETLRSSLESIVNNINEAIILVKNFQITDCNPAAEKLLGLTKNGLLKQNSSFILGSDWQNNNETEDNSGTSIIFFNNKKLYVSFLPFASPHENQGIFTFKEIQDIEKLEENVRKMLYKKERGYIAKYKFPDIIAESESMRDIIATAQKMALFDSTILISGESGTGKELLAQSIHNASSRQNGPFVAVNFGAIPDNLIESELFGYEEGAFTGAKRSGKKGLFELAHNGTIFLDEIGNSSTWIQSRLLRVLEEKELMRLGDTKIIPVNVRVIAATNKNLKELISQQLFREDLYYRLNVFPINIPPLRNRKECIFSLIKCFLGNSSLQLQKIFSDDALSCIMNYSWPGNIRELRNMIDYISMNNFRSIIRPENLPYDVMTSLAISARFSDNDIAISMAQITKIVHQQDLLSILTIFFRNQIATQKAGRSKIISELKQKNINMTYGKLRTIMQYLERGQLIDVGKTRQCTVLSEKGLRFYQHLLDSEKQKIRMEET